MRDLELLGLRTAVGFDWQQAVRGAAGALQTAGGLMSGGGAKGSGPDQAEIERRRREEEERREAAERARTLKIGLGVGGAALGVLALGLLVGRRR